MKILALEPHPNFGGGSEAMILSLSTLLAGRGHEISLLCEADGSMTGHYARVTQRILRTPLPGFTKRRPMNILAQVRAIGRAARLCGTDAIISWSPGHLEIAALVRQFYGVPSLFHLGLPARISRMTRRFSYRRLFGVTPSKHTMNTWARDGWPASSLATIPNWVDANIFAPVAGRRTLRQELEIPLDAPCIVYMGRIEHVKGVDVLVDGFARLAEKLADAVLVVVGHIEPSYAQNWATLMNSLPGEVRSRVLVKGETAEPWKYYPAADVACVPSREEAFGLTALEGMASAIPVLASDVGLLGQIIGDETLIFQKGNPESLCDALYRWLSNPKACREKGQVLRQRAIETYGPENGVAAYETHLAQLASVSTPGLKVPAPTAAGSMQ